MQALKNVNSTVPGALLYQGQTNPLKQKIFRISIFINYRYLGFSNSIRFDKTYFLTIYAYLGMYGLCKAHTIENILDENVYHFPN